MYRKLLGAVAIGALVSTAAIAQGPKSTQDASAKGEWQASKLIHMNVYNGQNEKIGDIKELLLDRSGKIEAVAVGVGGFIGMGEHDVAVKFDQLRWVNEPVPSTNLRQDRPPTTGSNQTESQKNYPNHAVLDATKDELKSMPQFNYKK
jgi:sporulation protein YlmC with PRC-barrel domain